MLYKEDIVNGWLLFSTCYLSGTIFSGWEFAGHLFLAANDANGFPAVLENWFNHKFECGTPSYRADAELVEVLVETSPCFEGFQVWKFLIQ